MKTKEEVLALFRAKYGYLQSVCHPIKQFEESLVYQLPDGGWQIDLGVETFGPDGRPIKTDAAITLRPDSDEPHETHGGICNRWYHEGGAFDGTLDGTKKRGWLGHPISDEEVYEADGDPEDRISHFENGDIVWTAKKPEETHILDVKGDTDNEVQPLQPTPSPAPSPIPATGAEPITQQSAPATLALPESAKRLKNFIGEKLDEIDRLASGLLPSDGEIHKDWKKAAEEARKIRKKLQPYLDAFESQAFLIVTFGMLKAGKSTLVNTLVGDPDISPVGRGRETTKRSSIIFAADAKHPEGVYVYTPKGLPPPGEEDEWNKEKCEHLILALGGVGNLEEEFIVEQPRKTIYELLTERPKKRELPPVIRIQPNKKARFPQENLLKDGVAILDTPGLDGIEGNATTDSFWEVLPAQGDFFLLVQSSMSGLNNDCATQIANIYAKTETSPGILIVYNEIDAQFWLEDGVQKQSLKNDRTEVEKYLREQLLAASKGAEMDIVAVNAGAASAAQFDNSAQFSGKFANAPELLLAESRIGDLTDKLRTKLRAERTEIKLARLKGLMGKDLESIAKEIEDCLKNFPNAEKEFASQRQIRSEAESSVSTLKAAFMDAGNRKTITASIASTVIDYFKKSIDLPCIEDTLKQCKPSAFVLENKKWAEREECYKMFCKGVEMVARKCLAELVQTIDSGAAMLKTYPWSTFQLPDNLNNLLQNVAQYVGNETLDGFRIKLLSNIVATDLVKSVSWEMPSRDDIFAAPGRFRHLFHRDMVSKAEWEVCRQGIADELEVHFGKQGGTQKCPATRALQKFIETSIPDAGREKVEELQKKVEQKADTDGKNEKTWEDNNNRVIRDLQQIINLASEVLKELRKD